MELTRELKSLDLKKGIQKLAKEYDDYYLEVLIEDHTDDSQTLDLYVAFWDDVDRNELVQTFCIAEMKVEEGTEFGIIEAEAFPPLLKEAKKVYKYLCTHFDADSIKLYDELVII